MDPSKLFESLSSFFASSLTQKASQPLRAGVELSIIVNNELNFALVRNAHCLSVENREAFKPDITFYLGESVPSLLSDFHSEKTGELGLFILRLMTEKDESKKIKAKVHINGFQMFRNGYFSILALGGAPVMSFLAKKGLGSFSTIKHAISELRSE